MVKRLSLKKLKGGQPIITLDFSKKPHDHFFNEKNLIFLPKSQEEIKGEEKKTSVFLN